MNIRILPLPKGGRKGGSLLSTIGRYSRPFLKQLLRIGLDKLKQKAISKIKKAGDSLTKVATMQHQDPQQLQQPMQQQSIQSKGGYKLPDVPTSFIHSPFVVEKKLIKKRRKKSKKKIARKSKVGGKKKVTKKVGRKRSIKKKKSASVFDRL